VPDDPLSPASILVAAWTHVHFFRFSHACGPAGRWRCAGRDGAVAAGLERDYPTENQNQGALLTPLRSDLVADVKPTVLLLFAAVGLSCCSSRLPTSRGCSHGRPRGIRRWRSGSRSAPARADPRQLLTRRRARRPRRGAGLLLAMWPIGPLVSLSPADLAVAGTIVDRRVLAFALIV
jgi:hypothetical protein